MLNTFWEIWTASFRVGAKLTHSICACMSYMPTSLLTGRWNLGDYVVIINDFATVISSVRCHKLAPNSVRDAINSIVIFALFDAVCSAQNLDKNWVDCKPLHQAYFFTDFFCCQQIDLPILEFRKKILEFRWKFLQLYSKNIKFFTKMSLFLS